MSDAQAELDALQLAYKDAVEDWIESIREEEALASVDHDVAKIDLWEAAGFHEEAMRRKVKTAKAAYEDALRHVNYDF
jgi:hypothetical protein